MAKCAYCKGFTFMPKKDGDKRYCSAACMGKGQFQEIADGVPPAIVAAELNKIHIGACPRCKGPGPVDLHTSHQVWSALILTQWKSVPRISCKPCGVKAKLGDAGFSFLLGWWGIPWGIVITPVQVLRNLGGLAYSPDPSGPSPALEQAVRYQLASNFVANQKSAGVQAARNA